MNKNSKRIFYNSTQSFKRLKIIKKLLYVAVLVIIYALIRLCWLESSFLQQEGDKRTIRSEPIAAHRGIIFDRNGTPLAISTLVTSIWAVPEELRKAQDSLEKLAVALEVSKNWLEQKLASASKKDFMHLKRKLAPEKAQEVLALNIHGVHAIQEQKRYYPLGEVTVHVVGLTDIDDVGLDGIELIYNHILAGTDGKRRLLKDRKGQLVRQAELIKSASPGKELNLSIDSRIQFLAHKELENAVSLSQAKSGSLVILDIATGEILALVNQPVCNPNDRTHLQLQFLRNRAIADAIEPGSAIKPFIIAAALQTKLYNERSRINTYPGYLKLGKYQITDGINHGSLNFTNILKKSSNVGVAKIALKLGEDTIRNYLQWFGFGQNTGLGLPYEHSGFLPYKTQLSPIELATLSFGYGLTVTPLQLARAYMLIGSGGFLKPLSLLKQEQIPKGKRILDEAVAKTICKMLNVVVKEGSGYRAKIANIQVGGKTGTTRMLDAKGYSMQNHRSLFAGLAPIDNPKLAIVVVIDDPQFDRYYGSQVAAPVFSKVASASLKILGHNPKK